MKLNEKGFVKCLMFHVFVSFAWLNITVVAANSQTMKIYTESLAPVHYEENGRIRGIATEIVEAIFDQAGLRADVEMYPWKRAYQKVLNNDDSLIYTINRTAKREPLFQWIGPILSKNTYLYRLKSRNDIKIASLEDAKKYTTAVILGHSLTIRLRDNGFTQGQELIITPDKKVQIKVFLKGRSDLITGNQYTIYKALKDEGLTINDVEPALFISSKGYYIGANRNCDKKNVQRLREANQIIQSSGKVQQIVNRYMKE